MIEIEIARQHETPSPVDPRWEQAVRAILESQGIEQARVSLAILDDPTIHELNRRYLEHDYPTDVLSFLLEREGSRLEGEVLVSADTAARVAEQFDWPAADELLLYIIHGTLHLVGFDDVDAERRREMRCQERTHLARFDLAPRFHEDTEEADVH